MSEKSTCKMCKFFVKDVLSGNGACRRNPPTPVPVIRADKMVLSFHVPMVSEDFWCGQFVLADQKESD